VRGSAWCPVSILPAIGRVPEAFGYAWRNMSTLSDWSPVLTISYHAGVKTIPAAKFKEQCLAILDRVDPEGIVITKRGRPVAKLIPLGADSGELIGSLAGKLRITDDVTSTGLRWDAESGHARPPARARRKPPGS
jgi:prevent-host-death family protein